MRSSVWLGELLFLVLAAGCSVVNAPLDPGGGGAGGAGAGDTGGNGGGEAGGGGSGGNHPPELLNLPGETTALVGMSRSFAVQAIDPDGDTLGFETASETCSFAVETAASTGQVTFTCGAVAEQCEAVIRVTDDGEPPASVEGTLQISCSADLAFTSNAPATASEGAEYRYDVSCADPAANPVTLSVGATDDCAGSFEDAGDGTGVYRFTPTEAQGGSSCLLALVCEGGGDQVTQDSEVTIIEVNETPTITNLPTTVSGTVNEAGQLQVTATDADQPSNALTFSLAENACTFDVAVSDDGLVSWTCGATTESCAATVRVTDDGVPPASSTGTVSIECQGVDCVGNGMTPLVIGTVVLCYTNQPGTCQQAHERCEGLGQGYRLMCGDDWQPNRDGTGCGGTGSYTGYDLVNQYFPGNEAIGGFNSGQYDCVSGGLNNNCTGDSGWGPEGLQNGRYAFCSPKNYFTAATDGPEFSPVCGN